MTKNTTAPRTVGADDTAGVQLVLIDVDELAESTAHTRFRLNKATRERGLRHVAEIRKQLELAKEARERSTGRVSNRSNVVELHPKHAELGSRAS